MNAIPVEYLHLETAACFLFLCMVFGIQLRRSMSKDYDALAAHAPLRWAPALFALLAVGFVKFMLRTAPLLGIELAAGVTLSLLHPVNALCFMAHLMLLRPWEILPDDPLLSLFPRLLVGLCLVSYLIHPRHRPRLTKRNVRPLQYLLLFSGWLLLTTVKIPGRAAVIAQYFDTYIKTLTAFVMCVFFVESELSVREVELTLAFSALGLMANGCYLFSQGQTAAGRMHLSYGKTASLIGDSNDLGAVVVMAVPFLLVPAMSRRAGLFARAGGLLYAGLAAVTIWLTRSRGTMLAVVGQFLMFRAASARRRSLPALILTACLLGGGYLGLTKLVPREQEDMDASGDSRITYWQTAVNMAAHNPLMGVGFGQYPENYMGYAVGTIYERGNRTAHSSWFLALGESGFVGFAFFVAFFGSVVKLAWRARDKRRAQLYAVAGYGVAMSFLSHTYAMDFYLLMGLIIASAGLPDAPAPKAAPEPEAAHAR